MPQSHPVAHAEGARRRRPYAGHARGSYVSRPLHAASLSPQLFRIG